jgi:hypothetical protein
VKQRLPKQNLELLESICSYEVDDYEELKVRLIGYYKKAKVDGIIALEPLMVSQTNKTVTEIFMLCIDGYSSNFVSNYMDIKAFWLIELAKRDSWKNKEYVVALAKELYLIKKLALSTMQAKDVQIKTNFNDVELDAFIFTKYEEETLSDLRTQIDKHFTNTADIDDSFAVDIKYLIDLLQGLSKSYRYDGVEVFIDNSLKTSHKSLIDIFIKAVSYEGVESVCAKDMLSTNKDEFYKNKELFTLHLAVRYILDGHAPRSVKRIVQLVYPEIKFDEGK